MRIATSATTSIILLAVCFCFADTASAQFRPLHRAGRFLGIGWGNGYHTHSPGPVSNYYSPYTMHNSHRISNGFGGANVYSGHSQWHPNTRFTPAPSVAPSPQMYPAYPSQAPSTRSLPAPKSPANRAPMSSKNQLPRPLETQPRIPQAKPKSIIEPEKQNDDAFELPSDFGSGR